MTPADTLSAIELGMEALQARVDALVAENAALRTLMDCYNLGGWTDSLRLMQERNALRDWLAGDANCPCCGQTVTCAPDCTFADDCPGDAERMQTVRDLLKETP